MWSFFVSLVLLNILNIFNTFEVDFFCVFVIPFQKPAETLKQMKKDLGPTEEPLQYFAKQSNTIITNWQKR